MNDAVAKTPGPANRLAVFLPSFQVGGAERAMFNLVSELSDRGWEIDVLLASAIGVYLSQVPSNVRIINLDSRRALRALTSLAAYLRRVRPPALLSAMEYADLVAMAAARVAHSRTRTVISIQNTVGQTLQDAKGFRDRSVPWLLGRMHGWADAIVAVSEGVADDLVRSTGIPRGRIDVIYNPVITPALLHAARERPSHPWFEDASCPVVLGVGRLRMQKNFRLLVEAFALVCRNRKARLVIFGEGSERPELEALVRARGLQDSVAIPGVVKNPYACMARASVFALSSDWEGLPTVLIESLAVGTPVVSTDCPSGPREILCDGKLGALVPVGDAPALARAISAALDTPRQAISSEALRPFTVDAVADKFETVLRSCA